MGTHQYGVASSVETPERIAAKILGEDLSLSNAALRVVEGCIEGKFSFNESCEYYCDVVDHLHTTNFFKSDLNKAIFLRSALLSINREFQKRGKHTFPPMLPVEANPYQYFTLPDAAHRLGMILRPGPLVTGQISGARGLTMAVSQVYPGWWLVGTRWGKDEELVWFDRFDFESFIQTDVISCERPPKS